MKPPPILTEQPSKTKNNTKKSLKSSIIQQLPTDLGRPVGETSTVTQLVCFIGLRVRPTATVVKLKEQSFKKMQMIVLGHYGYCAIQSGDIKYNRHIS